MFLIRLLLRIFVHDFIINIINEFNLFSLSFRKLRYATLRTLLYEWTFWVRYSSITVFIESFRGDFMSEWWYRISLPINRKFGGFVCLIHIKFFFYFCSSRSLSIILIWILLVFFSLVLFKPFSKET